MQDRCKCRSDAALTVVVVGGGCAGRLLGYCGVGQCQEHGCDLAVLGHRVHDCLRV